MAQAHPVTHRLSALPARTIRGVAVRWEVQPSPPWGSSTAQPPRHPIALEIQMKLTPVQQEAETWSLVEETGKTVRKWFPSRQHALDWATEHGYETNDTGGEGLGGEG